MPPRQPSQALVEFRHILKPGGLLAVCEPSPDPFEKSPWALFRKYGLKGLYFGGMARSVFEPFIQSWHKEAGAQLFIKHGCDEPGMPVRHFLLRKPS